MYVYRHRTFSRAPFGIFVAIAMMFFFLAGCSPASPSGDTDATTSASSTEASVPTDANGMSVFFSKANVDPAQDCNAVYPVARTVPPTGDTATELMQQLLAGPTQSEIDAGYRSFFSPATSAALQSVVIRNGTAYVNLSDLRSIIPNASSSCGSAAFLAQINRTLGQAPGVSRVILAINGDTRAFYEWLQTGCSAENDQCDNTPFGGSSASATSELSSR